MSDLSLEKINADRITSVEERLTNEINRMESKIDKVLEIVAKQQRPNGGPYLFVIQGLIVTLLLTIIGAMGMRMTHHEALEGHPKMIRNMATIQAQGEYFREKMKDMADIGGM